MLRRPPGSTRTDTLFPYTSLFRSIQASYNPICDEMGRPFKVVKYATDVTAQVRANEALQQAVHDTQEVVAAARAGDLTQRIALDAKAGSVRELCDGVNSLAETSEERRVGKACASTFTFRREPGL